MAHFSSVNENALIAAINQCKSKLSVVQSSGGDIGNEAKSIDCFGTKTRDNIVSSAVAIGGLLDNLLTSLDSCLDLANKIKQYKAQKKLVDDLKKKLTNLKQQVVSLKANSDAAYNAYYALKDDSSKAAQAQEYYNTYVRLNAEYQKKNTLYEKIKKEYKQEKDQLEIQASALSGMGFPPESN